MPAVAAPANVGSTVPVPTAKVTVLPEIVKLQICPFTGAMTMSIGHNMVHPYLEQIIWLADHPILD